MTAEVRRGVTAAALGAIIISFSGTYVRLADTTPATAAFWRCLWAAPFLWIIARREDRRLGPRSKRQRAIGLWAGVAFAADLILWHWSIREIGAGIGTVLGNLSAIVMTLLAWAFLSEKPSRSTLIALPVVFSGVILTAGLLSGTAYGANPVLGVLFGVGCSFAYGIYLLLLRQGNVEDARVAGPLADATVVAAVVSLLLGPLVGGIDLSPSYQTHFWLVLLAWTCQVLAWIVITYGLGRLPAALGGMILLIQPAAGVVISAIVVNERPSVEQVVGCAVIVMGIVVAILGNSRGSGRRDTKSRSTVPS